MIDQHAFEIIINRYDLSSFDIAILTLSDRIAFSVSAVWTSSDYTNPNGHKVIVQYGDTLEIALRAALQALNEKLDHDMHKLMQIAA